MYLIWLLAIVLAGLDHSAPKDSLRDVPGGLYPQQANWKAHNYNHLLEQPTIFYAIAIALILMGFDIWINVYLAWAYVAFRILHSLVQVTVNVVFYRFLLFILASLCLVGLTTHAAIFLIHG